MSYNAVTIPPSLAMSSPDAPGLTPESNARDIASLTQALDMVVSQFVRPSVQQASANRETLNEVIDLLSRHAQGLLSQEQRVDQLVGLLEGVRDIVAQNAQQIAVVARQQQTNAQQIAQNAQQISAIAQQQQVNAQQIAQNAEAITAFDSRLEETRQLVAKNASDIAQASARHDREIAELRVLQQANAQQIADNAQQVIALAEASRTQLAGIIGNANRISRLEQQAS